MLVYILPAMLVQSLQAFKAWSCHSPRVFAEETGFVGLIAQPRSDCVT